MRSDAPTLAVAPEPTRGVACPYCESRRTRLVALYASTISDSLFGCRDCGATFGWMKAEGRRAQDVADGPRTRRKRAEHE